MKASQVERRGTLRQSVQGEEARLRQSGANGATFLGRLVDQSAEGFRLRHSCLTLASGDSVEFEYHGRRGAARAMWTRIVGNEAETGFNILREAN